jgi:hypothetical protein
MKTFLSTLGVALLSSLGSHAGDEVWNANTMSRIERQSFHHKAPIVGTAFLLGGGIAFVNIAKRKRGNEWLEP